MLNTENPTEFSQSPNHEFMSSLANVARSSLFATSTRNLRAPRSHQVTAERTRDLGGVRMGRMKKKEKKGGDVRLKAYMMPQRSEIEIAGEERNREKERRPK